MEHLDLFWSLISRKLAGEASDAELQELNNLLDASPELRAAARELSAIWQMPAEPDQEYLEATYLMMRNRMLHNDAVYMQEPLAEEPPLARKPIFLRRVPVLTLSLIFLLAASIIWYLQGRDKSMASVETAQQPVKEVVTNKASKTKLVLPDGTIAWLNSGSKLTYGNWVNQATREVVLIGEGYFDVARNPDKPFIIHTSVLDVKVLGTRFNLKAYPDEATTETSLLHGSVEVVLHKQPGKVIRLVPNQKLVVQNALAQLPAKAVATEQVAAAEILPLKTVQIGGAPSLLVETSWVSNKLVFVDEPFADIARKMERWYDIHIQFNNQQAQELRLTGSFENESLSQALEALRFIADFRYTIHQDTITIY
jgi:ferric-dicitrate binding protein FerR (iron transport regulator)